MCFREDALREQCDVGMEQTGKILCAQEIRFTDWSAGTVESRNGTTSFQSQNIVLPQL